MHTNWTLLLSIVGGFIFGVYALGLTYAAVTDQEDGTTTILSSTENNPVDNNTPISDSDFDLNQYQNASATIETDKGNITFKLFPSETPRTAENFIRLAESGYYDGLSFHRVIDGFMAQGGDPTGTGSGGESIFGESFEDEINADSLGLNDVTVGEAGFLLRRLYSPDQLEDYASRPVKDLYVEVDGYNYRTDISSRPVALGTVAMANTGANTNGSQFFIVTDEDQPHLDGKHTVFAEVTAGLEVARQLEQGDTMNRVVINQ